MNFLDAFIVLSGYYVSGKKETTTLNKKKKKEIQETAKKLLEEHFGKIYSCSYKKKFKKEMSCLFFVCLWGNIITAYKFKYLTNNKKLGRNSTWLLVFCSLNILKCFNH